MLEVSRKQLENSEHSLQVCEKISVTKNEIIATFEQSDSLYQEELKKARKSKRKAIIRSFGGGLIGGVVIGLIL